MRKHEVRVLPYDFFGRLEIYGLDPIPVVKSFTSKIDARNYSESTVWVSCERLEGVAEVLQKIARIFCMMNTVEPVNVNDLPIFIGHTWGGSAEAVHHNYPLAKTGIYQAQDKLPDPLWFLDRINIESTDIDELVAFDAFRGWDSDRRFQQGNKWPLSSHQFRRSVAVYASRSGMVSLPSLTTQYKHLSPAMSALYGENSSFAKQILCKNVDTPESHGVIREFQDSQAFNAATRFHENVINNKNRLSGGTGKKIQRYKETNSLPLIMSDRAKTKKAISNGSMHFTETIVGGCLLNETCKDYGVYDVLPCVGGCPEAILEDEKVADYMEGLKLGLNYMDVDSLQYRAAQKEIDEITARSAKEVKK